MTVMLFWGGLGNLPHRERYEAAAVIILHPGERVLISY